MEAANDVQIIISDESVAAVAAAAAAAEITLDEPEALNEVNNETDVGLERPPLSVGLASFWETGDHADVHIHCSDNDVIVKCHRLVLAASSPMLREALLQVPEGQDDQPIVILLPAVSSESLTSLLESIYKGGNRPAEISTGLEFLNISYYSVQSTSTVKPSLKRDFREKVDQVATKEILSQEEDAAEEEGEVEHLEPPPAKRLKTAAVTAAGKTGKLHARKRSLAWKFFTPLTPRLAECTACHSKFSTPGSSTTLLSRHLAKTHPDVYQQVMQNKTEVGGAAAAGPPTGGGSKVTLGPTSSIVWDMFDHHGGDEASGGGGGAAQAASVAVCRICRQRFNVNAGSSTSQLLRHGQQHHPEKFDQLKSKREEIERQVLFASIHHPIWNHFDERPGNRFQCRRCSWLGSNIRHESLETHLSTDHSDLYATEYKAKLTTEIESTLKTAIKVMEKQTFLHLPHHNVWQNYQRLSDNSAKCKLCQTVLECYANYRAGLLRHWKFCHPQEYAEFKAGADDVFRAVEEGPDSTLNPLTTSQKMRPLSVDEITVNFKRCLDEAGKGGGGGALKCCHCDFVSSGDKVEPEVLETHLREGHLSIYQELCRKAVHKRPPPSSQSGNAGGGGGGKPSIVWKFFKSVTVDSSRCQLCDKLYTNQNGSTTGMRRHLEKCHRQECEAAMAGGAMTSPEMASSVDVVLVDSHPIWRHFDEEENNRCRHCNHYNVMASFDDEEDDEDDEVRLLEALENHLRAQHADKFAGYQSDVNKMSAAHPPGGATSKGYEEPPPPPSSDDAAAASTAATKKMAKRSAAWFFFDPPIDGVGDSSAVCKACREKVKVVGSSTTFLIRHLKANHRSWYDEFVRVKGTRLVPDMEALMTSSAAAETMTSSDGDVIKTKRSAVWHFFKQQDKTLASCNTCQTEVKTSKSSNTTVLFRHLERHHPDKYREFKEIRQEMGQPNIKSQQLEAADYPGSSTTISSISPTWNFFTKSQENSRQATCNHCLETFQVQHGTTTQLIRHLKNQHQQLYTELVTMQQARIGRGGGLNHVQEQQLLHPNSGSSLEANILKDFYVRLSSELVQCTTCESSVKNEAAGGGRGEVRPSHHLWSHLKNAHTDLHDQLRSELSQMEENLLLLSEKHPIWSYFNDLDSLAALCKVCKEPNSAKEGGEGGGGFTSRLSVMEEHLFEKHPQHHRDFDAEMRSQSTSATLRKALAKVTWKSGLSKVVWSLYKQIGDEHVRCLSCEIVLGTGTGDMNGLIAHIRVNHPELTPKLQDGLAFGQEKMCGSCSLVVATQTALDYHTKTFHQGQSPYQCGQCSHTFLRSDALSKHVARHSSVFLCTFCGAQFTSKASRRRHEQFSHLDVRKNECAHCERKFHTVQQLRNHERTHTGEKPYQCTDCGRQFTQQHQLKTHTRIHTGEYPYSCGSCNAKFRHATTRNNHKCQQQLQQLSSNSETGAAVAAASTAAATTVNHVQFEEVYVSAS